MNNLDSYTFTLEDFEGSLDFLWLLVQKNEIDIYAVSLKKIMEQFFQKIKQESHLNVEAGAEFVSIAASLHFLKSRMLLPKHEQEPVPDEEIDPKFEIIHQLMDYCRFKQTAKELAEREQKQSAFYFRGIDRIEAQKNLGVAHLSLEDLATLFQQLIAKASANRGKVHEEVWKVSDKIAAIRLSLQSLQKMPFELLFSGDYSREELIVTFLAILELMKGGEIYVTREASTDTIMIIHTQLKR